MQKHQFTTTEIATIAGTQWLSAWDSDSCSPGASIATSVNQRESRC